MDDVSTNRIVLKVKLASAYYQTIQAESGEAALRVAREERPDLILLDMNLPDIDGAEVCERLRRDPATRGIPVVIVSAARDVAMRLRALGAGAVDVVWKPFSDALLLARLRNVLRAREAEKELERRNLTYREFGLEEAPQGFRPQSVVAIVAPSPQEALNWKRELAAELGDRIVIADPEQALTWQAGNGAPDVVVVGADLDEPGEGLRLMSELRSRPATRFSAICVVHRPGEADTAAVALDLGASDVIEAGADPREVALRVSALIRRKHLADVLRASVEDGLRLAVTDPLTGLHNRRYAMPHLAQMAARAHAEGRQIAVMLLDLDRFKQVNDTFGHAAGDAVLVEVAARLRQNLRPADLLARFGGEEFLVALPDTTLADASRAAERLRHVVEARPVRLVSGTNVRVTLSVGLAIGAAAGGKADEVTALLDRADRALLAAKAEGRNQVTVSRSAA
ncbi:MAG: diguanylate cyclase [Rhodobacteraceae bacterium]|nr:diguanylate cyclase [Paracoccaceae bacterium]